MLLIVALTFLSAMLVLAVRTFVSLNYQHLGTRDTLDAAIRCGHEYLQHLAHRRDLRAFLVDLCGGEEHQAVEVFDGIVVRCSIPLMTPVRYSDAGIRGIWAVAGFASAIALMVVLLASAVYALTFDAFSFGLGSLACLAGIAVGLTIFYRCIDSFSWNSLVEEIRLRQRQHQPLRTITYHPPRRSLGDFLFERLERWFPPLPPDQLKLLLAEERAAQAYPTQPSQPERTHQKRQRPEPQSSRGVAVAPNHGHTASPARRQTGATRVGA